MSIPTTCEIAAAKVLARVSREYGVSSCNLDGLIASILGPIYERNGGNADVSGLVSVAWSLEVRPYFRRVSQYCAKLLIEAGITNLREQEVWDTVAAAMRDVDPGGLRVFKDTPEDLARICVGWLLL